MIGLIDRYFLKLPLVRRFLTKLVAGDREEGVTLLGRKDVVHTVREHGFRAARLAQTCSLFRDEASVVLHLAGVLTRRRHFAGYRSESRDFRCQHRKVSPGVSKPAGLCLRIKSGYRQKALAR